MRVQKWFCKPDGVLAWIRGYNTTTENFSRDVWDPYVEFTSGGFEMLDTVHSSEYLYQIHKKPNLLHIVL